MMKLKINSIKLKKQKKTVDREKLIYRASEYTYSFKHFQTIITFGRDIYNGKTTLKETAEDQSNLLVEIMNFENKAKPQNLKKKEEKEDILKKLHVFLDGRERVLDSFESKISSIKSKGVGFLNFDHSKLKMSTPQQMLQRLQVALVQVKAGNNSENLLNEISQNVYSLYQSNKITKKYTIAH